MNELRINCPNCDEPFELTEALAGPLLDAERRKGAEEAERRLEADRKAIAEAAADNARAEHAAIIADLRQAGAAKDIELTKAREAELGAHRLMREAEEAKQTIELEVARRVAAEAEVAATRAREETVESYAPKLKAAELALAESAAKRQAAEEAELAARTAKRQSEEALRTVELTVARKLDEERAKVREQALKERDDEHRLKLGEKDKQLADLKAQLDDLQRKAEQGSQQLKGDVLEIDLSETLSHAFPNDRFERVKKGQKGGDLIQTVYSPAGLACGRIKWEGKNTQKWSDTWLPKLREDQRDAKCDVAVLVTETLPDGVEYFDVVDDVWVSGIATAIPMATLLRNKLIDVATARRAAAGADSKKDIVYGYLTGTEFRARVRGLLEPTREMRANLQSEKRTANRQFALREKQIERVENNLSGMYGDLQGLVGPSLPTVEGLALPEPTPDELPDGVDFEATDKDPADSEVW